MPITKRTRKRLALLTYRTYIIRGCYVFRILLVPTITLKVTKHLTYSGRETLQTDITQALILH
ncbi:predicted protein [Sclerotinia sclerotiorum 1980 UF-70]|uniref:Uncharacterized protein n=1 Tax=Sclerotinia sclerotiorum (strain ATCC 18683 / 1980 / Ss-1) TaxID=665079 RepID=A7F8N5_SCLS1|nr:predicted protein [Sclerotinia sclerotiorum 1980 UF-70]EDN99106.1 predicted protein [Sclerotinia sclerotiorum 1980 UF-70]